MYDKIILISIGLAIILIVCLAMNQLKNEIRRSNILLDKMAKRLGVPEPSEDNKIKALIAEGKKMKLLNDIEISQVPD